MRGWTEPGGVSCEPAFATGKDRARGRYDPASSKSNTDYSCAGYLLWWVPTGHWPSLDEALERLADVRAHGDSARAFAWRGLEGATLWRTMGCRGVAA